MTTAGQTRQPSDQDVLANLVRMDSTDRERWLPAIGDQQIRDLGNYRGPVYGVNVPVPGTGTPSGNDAQPARRVRAGRPPGRPRPARPAVRDVDGLDLRPNPQQARTGAELVGALREFREWAGAPSFRTMAAQCAQVVSASTLHRTLRSRALPPFESVMAVITGCGGSEDDTRRFASAWRAISAANRLHAVRDTG
jgi:hypothetical protein